MARKKKGKLFKITFSKKTCLIICNAIVVLGLILLIKNLPIPKEPKHNISLHEENSEIYINETKRFGYTVTNYKETDNIVWSTSNSNIATVNENGVVKGVSFGDVIISVSLNNEDFAELKLRVKSYDVFFRTNVAEKQNNGWYNTPININFSFDNIDSILYCATLDECIPNKTYVNPINLSDGIWKLYVTGIDKNNHDFDFSNYYQVDTKAPSCTISRINKMDSIDGTIAITCLEDLSGVVKYEWYCDNEKILTTNDVQIYAHDIYKTGRHNYYVVAYDLAGNSKKYEIK